MAWRVHLSDKSVYRLDILQGTPDVLCAWISSEDVAFFDLETGSSLGGLSVEKTKQESETWQNFLNALRAPNHERLPYVRTAERTLHRTQDGKYTLYDDGHGLSLYAEGKARWLGVEEKTFVSVQMEQIEGIVAALDERGKLYIYERGRLTSSGDVGLQLQDNILPDVILSDQGWSIFASDSTHLLRISRRGVVEKKLTLDYTIGKIACSPDGNFVATTDSETGIIRVYSGEALNFTYQKFAVDLFAAARKVQLIADVPTPRLGVSALTITNAGVVAFAIGGIITVSDIEVMAKLPQV